MPILSPLCRAIAAMLSCLAMSNLLFFSGSALAQLQTGRDSTGTLWITDQPLPSGVSADDLELDQVMSLTPDDNAAGRANRSKFAPPVSPVTHQRMTRSEMATCQSIDQRYEETRRNLEKIMQDKASGKLLIPDSGLATIRQNLASLERMRALCPTEGSGR